MQRTNQRTRVRRRRNKHPEDDEQAALFRWRDLNVRWYPGIELMFAIPNGAFLHGDKRQRAAQWARLEKQGAKKGVHDIFLPVAKSGFHGLWIEMKSKTGKLSKEQCVWGICMLKLGYAAAACYGAEQATDVIIRYFKGETIETTNHFS